MFCEYLLINLSAFTITCLGDGLKREFPIATPKPGFEIKTGVYTLKPMSFVLYPKSHFFGTRLGRDVVGDRIICLDNERRSCIHYGQELGKKASHGCIRTSELGIQFIFENSLPGTEVIIHD